MAGKVPQKIVEITQATGKMSVKSADIIVCYGKRVFEMPELSKVADLKIWVDADPDLRLIWKIKRSPYYKEYLGKPKNPSKGSRNYGFSPHKGDRGVAESMLTAIEIWEKELF